MKLKKLSAFLVSGFLMLNNLSCVFAQQTEKVLTITEVNKIVKNENNEYGSPNKHWNEETGEFIVPDGYTKIAPLYSKDKNSEKCLIYNTVKKIVLPESVKELEDEALAGIELNEIILPEGMTKIGKGNFSMSNIKTIKWPRSVTRIEEGMFGYANLEEIEIPDTVTYIGNVAFLNTKLKEVYIPDSVTEIGEGAFYDCDSLEKVRLPKNITKIVNSFHRTAIEGIEIPENVKEIGYYTFEGSKLRSISLPQNVSKIGRDAFWFCEDLESVEMPGVTSLGDYAFSNCDKLKKLTVCKQFFLSKEISEKAFSANIDEFYDEPGKAVKENSVDVYVTDGTDGLKIEEIKAKNPWIRTINSINNQAVKKEAKTEIKNESIEKTIPNTGKEELGLASMVIVGFIMLALSNKSRKI